MKITVINGQNHKGSTYHMGRILAEQLAKKEDITEFFLPGDLHHFCLGCYSCIEDETRCPYWDEKKIILDAMEQADLLIFTSPNYCLAPSGAMKSFLDLFFDIWMVHRPKEWMFRKRAVILSSSAGATCGGVIRTIRDSLSGWGIPDIRTYARALQAMNWEMVKPEKKIKIEKDLKRIAGKIDCGNAPHIGIKTRLLFYMMGRMHAAGWDSSPVEKKYWIDHGWIKGEKDQ